MLKKQRDELDGLNKKPGTAYEKQSRLDVGLGFILFPEFRSSALEFA